jgi:hypothetical protein
MHIEIQTVIGVSGAILATILGIVGTVSDNRTGQGKLTIAGRFAIAGIVLGTLLSQVGEQYKRSEDFKNAQASEARAHLAQREAAALKKSIARTFELTNENLGTTRQSATMIAATAKDLKRNVGISLSTLSETQRAATTLTTVARTSDATLHRTQSVGDGVRKNLAKSTAIQTDVQTNVHTTQVAVEKADAIQGRTASILGDVDRGLFPFKNVRLSSALVLNLHNPTFEAYWQRLDSIASAHERMAVGRHGNFSDPDLPRTMFTLRHQAQFGNDSPLWPDVRRYENERYATAFLMNPIAVFIYKARSGFSPSSTSSASSSETDSNGWDLALSPSQHQFELTYDWNQKTALVTMEAAEASAAYGDPSRRIIGLPDLVGAKIVVTMPYNFDPKRASPFVPAAVSIHVGERRLTIRQAAFRPSRRNGTFWTVLPDNFADLMALLKD